MSHNWKIGDWAELHAVRYLVYAVHSDCVFGVRLSGSAQWKHDEAEHLPDCTGWDWQPPKPIEPPPGYRLVHNGNAEFNDKYLAVNGEWCRTSNVGSDIQSMMRNGGALAYARKIEPQYRPFANAAEFAPYKGRWVLFLSGQFSNQLLSYLLIYSFDDKGIWHAGKVTDWQSMFSQCKFEDGTPFGIATEKEATCAK